MSLSLSKYACSNYDPNVIVIYKKCWFGSKPSSMNEMFSYSAKAMVTRRNWQNNTIHFEAQFNWIIGIDTQRSRSVVITAITRDRRTLALNSLHWYHRLSPCLLVQYGIEIIFFGLCLILYKKRLFCYHIISNLIAKNYSKEQRVLWLYCEKVWNVNSFSENTTIFLLLLCQ